MATHAAAPPRAVPRDRVPLARALRRGFLVAAPVLAGGFAIVGASADPASGESGRAMWEAYAASPDPLQWKSFGFHWSYAFLTVAALLLALRVRERGAWLANVAGLLAFVGATTLPGVLVVDFYDAAIGQVAGVDTTEAVNGAMEGMWAVQAITVPGLIGALLALPLATLAAVRAGFVPWWTVLAVTGALVAFLGSGVQVWGTVVMAALLAALTVALGRSPRL